MPTVRSTGTALAAALLGVAITACGSRPTPEAELEEVLRVNIPSVAENVRVTGVSVGEAKRQWWLRFAAPPHAVEVFLGDIDVTLDREGTGDVYNPAATYSRIPPDWWFEGFDSSVTYQIGNGGPGGGTLVFVYVDTSSDRRWTASLEITDR